MSTCHNYLYLVRPRENCISPSKTKLYVIIHAYEKLHLLLRGVPVKPKILRFLRFLRDVNRPAKLDFFQPRKILKSILRFSRKVTRLGK